MSGKASTRKGRRRKKDTGSSSSEKPEAESSMTSEVGEKEQRDEQAQPSSKSSTEKEQAQLQKAETLSSSEERASQEEVKEKESSESSLEQDGASSRKKRRGRKSRKSTVSLSEFSVEARNTDETSQITEEQKEETAKAEKKSSKAKKSSRKTRKKAAETTSSGSTISSSSSTSEDSTSSLSTSPPAPSASSPSSKPTLSASNEQSREASPGEKNADEIMDEVIGDLLSGAPLSNLEKKEAGTEKTERAETGASQGYEDQETEVEKVSSFFASSPEIDEEIFDDILSDVLNEAKVSTSSVSAREPHDVTRQLMQQLSIGPATASKLIAAGLVKMEQLAFLTTQEIKERTGLTETTAERILQAARQTLSFGFETADQVLAKRQQLSKLSTGSLELDRLLGGGYEARGITELFGEFRTGKTQLCFQAAVNATLPREKGGIDSDVLFIDTEGTFRPERILQMAEAKQVDPSTVLSRIHVGRAYNSDHQLALLDEAPHLIASHDVKLVIVDSLTAHFRAEYIGRESLIERQQKLNKHLHQLLKLAESHDLIVLVTNQVQAKLDEVVTETIQPIGGHIVGHTTTTRIYLRMSRGNKRIARLVDSPNLPEGEAIFMITPNGIEDAQ